MATYGNGIKIYDKITYNESFTRTGNQGSTFTFDIYTVPANAFAEIYVVAAGGRHTSSTGSYTANVYFQIGGENIYGAYYTGTADQSWAVSNVGPMRVGPGQTIRLYMTNSSGVNNNGTYINATVVGTVFINS